MKALSLRQPWAELILQGRKTIETRKWNTKFRGEFLIHAAQAYDKKPLREFGFTHLPTGCVVGKAELVDVKAYDAQTWIDDVEKHLVRAPLGKKRYGFVLRNVQRVEPKPLKGKLNFFEAPW
jgi:hypothetical protein